MIELVSAWSEMRFPVGATTSKASSIAPVEGEIPTAAPAWIAERLPERGGREQARAVWLEAMHRPGLLAPAEARKARS